MAIAFRGAFGKSAAAQDTTPGIPTGTTADDICILCAVCPTANTISISADGSVTPWTAITGSPVSVTGGMKLYLWWGRFVSGSTGATVHASVSDSIVADMLSYSGCETSGSPINQQETGSETTSDTSFQFIQSVSTSVNDCMCLCAASILRDSNTASVPVMTNASLGSLASRANHCTNTGSGGGFGISEGTKAVAGTMGTWACTYAAASAKSYLAFALKPPAPGLARPIQARYQPTVMRASVW